MVYNLVVILEKVTKLRTTLSQYTLPSSGVGIDFYSKLDRQLNTFGVSDSYQRFCCRAHENEPGTFSCAPAKVRTRNVVGNAMKRHKLTKVILFSNQ